jgi:hypothetical protein|tara:strand:- start:254 stop:1621 length:1368 start_codon:yes stop_codon:yes gene_type:complete
MEPMDIDEIWKDDLLGFKSRGDAFTNLVTSIDDHRTISIEAGYGRGKTFFRKRWAEQLKAAGECVVEIDARLSDHSGDPVVTFLGALLAMVPKGEKSGFETALTASKKIGLATVKAVGKAVLKEGASEVADLFEPEDGENESLFEIAKNTGGSLSKAAGDLIATQLTAEKARKELGEQLKTLHAVITKDKKTNRIVILIDELDRCHPDYAIALLEAMKLIFDQDGFVFVLMVNSDYLESIAAHRFGMPVKGEMYLDKFVDLRLKLEVNNAQIVKATEALALKLPLTIPFGNHKEFSVERAASLAAELVPKIGLSMRQIERVLGRVELALRIYKDRPIDAPLLVWLSFSGSMTTTTMFLPTKSSFSRADLTPQQGKANLDGVETHNPIGQGRLYQQKNRELNLHYPELSELDEKTYRSPDDQNYYLCVRVYQHLAAHYIPEHQAMLDAVHALQVDS